ncbi:MAG: metallophosphoesterase [Gordonia sp. (in: high G+C Gram-positive bacteria)]|uniref:metallophosphoesterase n=1 Tax=Gordonia sp. (in: high G+C Gram-positive bacteria) TaxID=84139 RepID=UPI0039E3A2AB
MRTIDREKDIGMRLRVAVIGDVGGHLDELRRELGELGADRAGRLPDDLVVVQVGDLVHRGPDSNGVVRLVDHYLTTQPHQWIQLIGNHEVNYLRTPQFRWAEKISYGSRRTLKRWWRTGVLHTAVAVEGDDEQFLVSHAGVTESFWRRHLDAPSSARSAAMRINAFARTGCETLYGGGAMLGGGPNPMVGPLWADRADELVPGWLGRTLPFSQIHGHSGSHGESEDPLTVYDPVRHHEETRLDGGRIIGIDPGHLAVATTQWSSFVVTTSTPPRVA